MKPRIFINLHYLEIGGAETSLIGLLQALDPERVDVDLFLNDHRGEMMQYVPEWVNVLPAVPEYTMIERPMKEALCKGFLRLVVARLWAKFLHHVYMRRKKPIDGNAIFGYVGKYVTPVLPSLKIFGQYDFAISYLMPHNVVLDKVVAKKKVCWIHTDYTQIDVNTRLELPVWQAYDNIVSISEDVTRTFCQVFPSLRSKIIEMENILPTEMMKNRANEGRPADMTKKQDEKTLLTIARYSYPKRLEEIPAICRLLIDAGLNVKWYIIGYGGSDEYIRKAICEEGIEKRVILLGKRTNPYPYIQACDWYVQPSRYEGKSITVREAQVLCKSVIITAYPTATSQVKNGVDGIIVPMPIEDCADAMATAIRDELLQKNIIDYLSSHEFGNKSEVEKLYRLIA